MWKGVLTLLPVVSLSLNACRLGCGNPLNTDTLISLLSFILPNIFFSSIVALVPSRRPATKTDTDPMTPLILERVADLMTRRKQPLCPACSKLPFKVVLRNIVPLVIQRNNTSDPHGTNLPLVGIMNHQSKPDSRLVMIFNSTHISVLASEDSSK
ncbi:hypothetical protein CC86DRAFT_109829 [Ophiobolus disseminans]|uniref:Secreted protein n=1 Tax=Ophiobolus disseminans TaxID=1469910 RepID=A0A6A6ZLM9_9PLEO|nr:hypothetical protein CC86DRAFT_109829 [Ophiobolus disseminans]